MVIMLQSLAHTDDVVNCVAEPSVKLNDPVVRSPNLQIDFWTPGLPEQSFCFGDDGARIPTALQLRENCQIIEPASMALVTGHHASNNLTVKNAYQKQFRPDATLALNVSMGIIPGPNQVASLPKGHDRFLVV